MPLVNPEKQLSPTGGRLTLASGTPITTTDQTAKTRAYFTPYAGSGNGDRVVLYDAAGLPQVVEFSEVFIDTTNAQTGTRASTGDAIISGLTDTSQLIAGMEISGTGVGASSVISTIDSATQVTGTVNNTATGTATVTFKVPASSLVDVFAIASGSSIALRFGPLWSSSTKGASTRATGVSLNRGAYTLTGDTTRLLLGTIMTTTTAGETASSQSRRLVANVYNRIQADARVNDSTSHTYSGGSLREWNGGSDTYVQDVVVPIAQQVFCVVYGRVYNTAAGSDLGIIAFGHNSGTASTFQISNAGAKDQSLVNINPSILYIAGFNRDYLVENASSIDLSFLQGIIRAIPWL